jgi:CheY-like chemotaxis protein
VVEADASIGEVITDALETAGFAVQIARTATVALEALGGQSPDAILVDLAQPDEEGWEFLARCRQQPGCKSLPIGIMSTTLAELLRPRRRASGDMRGCPSRSSSTSCCQSWRT